MESSWPSDAQANKFLTQGAYMYLKWFHSKTEIIVIFFSISRSWTTGAVFVQRLVGWIATGGN